MKKGKCIIGLHSYITICYQKSKEVDSNSGAYFERIVKKCNMCGKIKYIPLGFMDQGELQWKTSFIPVSEIRDEKIKQLGV